jgi:tetratricopeptide (TPR) repeat protein
MAQRAQTIFGELTVRTLTTIAFVFFTLALCAGGALAGEEYEGDAEAGAQLERQAVRQFQEHQYAEAARLFERAWDAYQHPRYQYNIGQCYRRAGRWDEAIAAYNRRLELQPAPLSSIYAHIGYCQLQARRRDEANEAFRRYLELEPQGDMAAQVRRALEIGRWPEEERRPPEAVQAAREIHARAEQLCRDGEFLQAAEAYMEGYQQHGQIHELLLDAGICYMWATRTQQAIEALNRYIETPGFDTAAIAHLAECRITEGDLPAARDTYQRYLDQDPDGQFARQARHVIRFVNNLDPMPTRANVAQAKEHIARAFQHVEAGRYPQAQREFEASYEIVPAPTVSFNIGLCHYYRRQYDEALTWLLRYMERWGDEGEEASVHIDIARCLVELNRDEEAMQHIHAYRQRADAAELPREQYFRDQATELENRCKEDD